MVSNTFAGVVCAWVASLEFEDLPPEVVAKAGLQILDTIGCAFAGTRSDAFKAVQRLGFENESGRAPVIGTTYLVPADRAALANGMLMHALDFDDTHQLSYMHVSAPVLAAVLAVGAEHGATGEQILLAFVAGMETSIRLGMATETRMHLKGFHPTSVFGVVGAAVAVGKLLHMDLPTLISTVGISASLGSGVMAYLNDGTDTKTVHPGWAASSSVWAARLARAGVTGPATGIDGHKGLLATHVSDFGDLGTDTLGKRYQLLDTAVKPLPVCHSAHGGLNCMIEAMRLHDVALDQVESIHVRVPTQVVVDMVLEPVAQKARPRTLYEGKFSLPWLIGVLMKRGAIDLATLADTALLRDADVLSIAGKVTYELADLRHGNDLGAEVRLVLLDGTELNLSALIPLGLPGNEMTEADVSTKFRSNLRFAGFAAHSEVTVTALGRFERLSSDEISAILRAQGQPAPTTENKGEINA